MNKKQANIIEDNKVNFVCPTCDKRYYAMSYSQFNKDVKKANFSALSYKRRNHKCTGDK